MTAARPLRALICGVLLAAAGALTTASAQDGSRSVRLLPKLSLERILDQFKSQGVSASIPAGQDYVTGFTPGDDNIEFRVKLVGCTPESPCKGLGFTAILRNIAVGFDRINRWNKEGWFIKALPVPRTADTMMTWDIPASVGATDAMLAGYVSQWIENLPLAASFLSGKINSPNGENSQPEQAQMIEPTLEALRDFIKELGYSAEPARKQSGERYLILKYPLDGVVNVADCADQTSISSLCKKLSFEQSVVPATRASVDRVFFWNTDNLWGRGVFPHKVSLSAQAVVYLEKNGRVTLALERVTEGGISKASLAQDVKAWEQLGWALKRDFGR